MGAMGASISNKYNRTRQGLWMVLLGIPLLIAYGAGLILIIIGAIRMKGSGRAKKIRKRGQEGFGRIAYKIMENDERVNLLTKKRVVFYYQLENGLLGRTSESIDKRMYKALSKLLEENNGVIPIIKKGNEAVLDYVKLLDTKEHEYKEEDVNFSSQDPSYRYKYGEVTKKSIVFLSLVVLMQDQRNAFLG